MMQPNMAVWVACTSESKSLLLHFHHHKFIHSKSWKQTNYCFVLQVSLVPNTKRQAQQPHKNTNYVFTIDTSEILHTNKRASTDEPEAQEVGHMCKWAWTRADEPKTPWTGMNEGNTSVNEGWQANPYKHGQGWTRAEQPKTPWMGMNKGRQPTLYTNKGKPAHMSMDEHGQRHEWGYTSTDKHGWGQTTQHTVNGYKRG